MCRQLRNPTAWANQLIHGDAGFRRRARVHADRGAQTALKRPRTPEGNSVTEASTTAQFGKLRRSTGVHSPADGRRGTHQGVSNPEIP